MGDNANPPSTHDARYTSKSNYPTIAVTAADLATGTIAVIITVGIVALAIRVQPIPDVLALSLASIIAYYFGRSSRV